MATSLLLHCNGSNGSTTFTDVTGKVVTAQGNAQISTAQSVFGGASAVFDGNGDYLTVPDSDDWNFGSGDFTVEARIRLNSFPSSGDFIGVVGHWGTSVAPQRSWMLLVGNSAGTYQIQFSWSTNGGSNQTNHTVTWTSPSNNTWYHVAVTRSGTSIRTFIDGTQAGATTTTSDTFADSTNPLLIGALANNAGGTVIVYPFSGYIDEIRVVKGTAYYTGNFTPPAGEYIGDNPSITIGAGTATLAGAAPAVVTDGNEKIIAVGSGAVTVSGSAPEVDVVTPSNISVSAGSTAFSGVSPSPGISARINVSNGQIVSTGQVPGLRYDIKVSPSAGGLVGSGQEVIRRVGLTNYPPTGSMGLLGTTTAPKIGYGLDYSVATLSGYAPVLSQNITINVAAGGLTFTGQAPSIPVIAEVSYNVVKVTSRIRTKKSVTLKF